MSDEISIKTLIHEKANSIMGRYHVKTFGDTGEIFYYNEENGLYAPAELKFKTEISFELGESASRHVVLEILERIRCLTYFNRNTIDNTDLIPLKNGIFKISEGKTIDYSPDYFFIHKHPISFNSLAICPKINKFLDEITEGDVEKAWLLEKIAAYSFYRSYPLQNSFMLLGAGSNGKSVYLNLVRALLGNEFVSAVQLHDLVENRFAVANLYGKNANIFADLESRELKQTGMFKALTGGDYLTCDQKFKKAFPFVNTAKLIFSCNQLPETKDETDAFFRRWVVVEFNRQFNSSEQNTGLIGELTSDTELSGFFNQLMGQLKTILVDNKFTNESVNEMRIKYIRNANSAVAFIEECIEFDPDSEVPRTDVIREYAVFCALKKLPAITEEKLWKNIHLALGDKIYEARVKNLFTNERVRVFKGIRLAKDDSVEEKKIVDFSSLVLARMRSYKGKELPKVPMDFIMGAQWEDIVKVQESISQMKRNGMIFEPTNGFLMIAEQTVVRR